MGNKLSNQKRTIDEERAQSDTNDGIDDVEKEAFELGEMEEEKIVNKKPEDFSIRICTRFVPGNDDLCTGCREREGNGIHKFTAAGSDEDWNWETCTETVPTNAFGELKFPGSYSKRAKFIVIDHKTPVQDMISYLYSDTGFALPRPKMILSVTGGAQQFSIDEDTKTAFKLGLMKTAKTTDAWIITGGTNTGVMRLVGDAVAEDLNAQDLTVLGIASWGCIAFKENMVHEVPEQVEGEEPITHQYIVPYFPQQKKAADKQKFIPLNPNHSSFILVDNGSLFKFGVEIEFRTQLETLISSQLDIPIVLIVVEGGLGTLNTIIGALKSQIPIILVAKSKGCADLVRLAKEKTRGKSENHWPKILEEVFGLFKVKYDSKSQETIMKIISDPCYDQFVNVFQMNAEGCGSDIEQSILNALSKAKANSAQKIELAIKWNRLNIAREEMKKEREKTNEADKLKENELYDLLELALLENKYQFVNLLLECEIDLQKFLTVQRLKDMYNYEASQDKAKYEEPFLLFLQKKYNRIRINIDIKNIKKLNKELFPGCRFTFLPPDFEKADQIYDPEMNLFYWSVLSNRFEIAKIFWRLGKFQIPNALIASKFYSFFAKHLQDFESELLDCSRNFEDLAIGVLTVYDRNTRENVNDVLVIRYLKDLEMDILELAVHCKCKRFVSNSTVQCILDNIWQGKRNDLLKMTEREDELKRCQATYNDDERYVFKTRRTAGLNQNATKWQKFVSYFYIPFWHFILNLIFYWLFLILFSYTLLFKYKYDEEEVKVQAIKSYNATNMTDSEKGVMTKIISTLHITPYEIMLLIWILSIVGEEIRQFLGGAKLSSTTWGDSIKRYFKDQWNILDVIGCSLFILGFLLKSISLINERKEVFNAARVLLSIDCALWYMRSLHFYFVLESLGPKLLMIKKMFNDLKYFLIIIITFVLAFGVALQASLFPGDEFTPKIFLDIMHVAYWPIFGELGILEAINNETCLESGSTEPPCLDGFTHTVTYILLMVYMVIANVLLINLLIAMFSNTYEAIQDNSDVFWKNQRYELICEYVDSPILPPPLNLIIYVWFFIRKVRDTIGKKEIKKHQPQPSVIENDILIEYEQKSAQELLYQVRNDTQDETYRKSQEMEEKILRLEDKVNEILSLLNADRSPGHVPTPR